MRGEGRIAVERAEGITMMAAGDRESACFYFLQKYGSLSWEQINGVIQIMVLVDAFIMVDFR